RALWPSTSIRPCRWRTPEGQHSNDSYRIPARQVMSDLQLGLILLGVLLILIVLVFNWWQDRRIRRRMQEHFPENDHDPLMAGSATPERREPALGVRLAAEPEADDPPVHDPEEVDPGTEAVIDIKFAQPVE